MKTSNMMVDLVADGFEEVLENLMARKRGATTAPSTPAASTKKLRTVSIGTAAPVAAPAVLGPAPTPPAGPRPSPWPPVSQASGPSNSTAKFKAYYNVDETDDLIQLSKSCYSLSKVQAHFGETDKCWAVGISNKPNPEDACPLEGAAGHKPGDPLHTFAPDKRKYFSEHRNQFTKDRVGYLGNGRP
jgi:hypothetical protein